MENVLEQILPYSAKGDLLSLEEHATLKQNLERFLKMQLELNEFAVQLSAGNLDADPPPRTNHFAAGMKALQAQLRHLTWQAQCIADGDYNQRIDFMGEFSEAFNRMVIQLKEREGKILRQQEFMLRLYDKLEPLIVMREDGTVLYENSEARRLFFHEGELDADNPVLQAMRALPHTENEHEIEASGRWYGVSIASIPWSVDETALVYYCQDITAFKERETSLETEANTDKLTNLSNRRALEQFLHSYWEISTKTKKPLSVLLFDIDHFKNYNDSYGHLQGDHCLAAFARLLTHHVTRANDIVARYGGEEFLAILPFTGLEGAMRIAEEVRAATCTMRIPAVEGAPDDTSITVSCGVCAMIPNQAYSPSQFLSAADFALYAAKQAGRNRVAYHDIEKTTSTVT